MKSQNSLLHNCYFQICQFSDPNFQNNQYDHKEALALPIKRERISLKRTSETNRCSIKGAKPRKSKAEDEQTRTDTERLGNLKFTNMQTMESTHRFDQERPQYSERVRLNYSTRTYMTKNEPNVMNVLSQFGSQEKLDSFRSKKEKNVNGKMQNFRSQPLFIRKSQFFQGTVELSPHIKSRVQSPLSGVNQSQKKASKYQLRWENGHKRSVTIYSIDSQSRVEQKIEQSMIQIDFFHPSTRRLLDLEKE